MAVLHVETLPDLTVAALTARSLDESNAEAVGKELAGLVARLGGRPLELDLGQVEFLASLGLAELIALYKQVHAAGGRLRLRNVRPDVYEVFVNTRLTSLLDVRP
jgi:anti-sigma B factor antagonist